MYNTCDRAAPFGSRVKKRDRLGLHCLTVLRDWLVEEHRKRGIASCGRVKSSYHRGEAGLATGLNLEAPSPGARFALAGHRLLGHSQSLDVRRAALATGGSGWYHRHRIPTQRYTEVKCLCTLLWPSRGTARGRRSTGMASGAPRTESRRGCLVPRA